MSNDFDWWMKIVAFLDIGDIPENINCRFLKKSTGFGEQQSKYLKKIRPIYCLFEFFSSVF